MTGLGMWEDYQFRPAIAKEVLDNPFRCTAAGLSALAIIISTGFYLDSLWRPEKSYVMANPLTVSQAGSHYSAQASFYVVGHDSIRDLKGIVLQLNKDNKVKKQPLSLEPGVPGEPIKNVNLSFDEIPERVTFCLDIVNNKGAHSEEQVIYNRGGVLGFEAHYTTDVSTCPKDSS